MNVTIEKIIGKKGLVLIPMFDSLKFPAKSIMSHNIKVIIMITILHINPEMRLHREWIHISQNDILFGSNDIVYFLKNKYYFLLVLYMRRINNPAPTDMAISAKFIIEKYCIQRKSMTFS